MELSEAIALAMQKLSDANYYATQDTMPASVHSKLKACRNLIDKAMSINDDRLAEINGRRERTWFP